MVSAKCHHVGKGQASRFFVGEASLPTAKEAPPSYFEQEQDVDEGFVRTAISLQQAGQRRRCGVAAGGRGGGSVAPERELEKASAAIVQAIYIDQPSLVPYSAAVLLCCALDHQP